LFKKVLLALSTASLLTSLLIPTGTALAVPNPLTCEGYPEPRVFTEVQSWWEGNNVDGVAHVHGGTCFPVLGTVSGTVHFDVRVMMHNNPGTLTEVFFGVFNYEQVHGIARPNARCDDGGSNVDTCTFWYSFNVDTTKAGADGLMTFRMKPQVTLPDGKEMFTSGDWPVTFDNGFPQGGSHGASVTTWALVNRGWYDDGFDYQNPDLQTPSALNSPFTGIEPLKLRLDAGSGGFPTTYSAMLIDPDFHNPDPSKHKGTVIFERNGPTRLTYNFDTTVIPDGPHRLVLLSAATVGGQTNTGVSSVNIVVDNDGGPTPTPTPVPTPVPTPTPTPGTATFLPTDDGYVWDGDPNRVFNNTTIRTFGLDETHRNDSYVKFNVTGTPVSATLRFFVTQAQANSGNVHEAFNNWSEATLTWNNQPGTPGGIPIDEFGPTTVGTWEEIDVSDEVTGPGEHSFMLTGVIDASTHFSSSEGSNPPQLVVEY
jgi:hypothetical protein